MTPAPNAVAPVEDAAATLANGLLDGFVGLLPYIVPVLILFTLYVLMMRLLKADHATGSAGYVGRHRAGSTAGTGGDDAGYNMQSIAAVVVKERANWTDADWDAFYKDHGV